MSNSAMKFVIQLVVLVVLLGVLGVSIVTFLTVRKNDETSSTVKNTVPTTVTQTDVPRQSETSTVAPTAKYFDIPTANPIAPNQPNYQTYKQFAELLDKWANTSIDPCTNFYSFTCAKGAATSQSPSFDVSDSKNVQAMLDQIKKPAYTQKASLPVQQLNWFYQACVEGGEDEQTYIDYAKAMVDEALKGTGAQFPLLYQNQTVKVSLDPSGMAHLLGFLMGRFGVSSLISGNVDTNWEDPHGPQGYAFFIDQPSTFYQYAVYQKVWQGVKESATEEVIETIRLYAINFDIQFNDTELEAAAIDLVKFDYALATEFSTSDVVRRSYKRSYRPMTIDQLQMAYPAIDWITFIKLTLAPVPSTAATVNGSFTAIVMEADKLNALNAVLTGLDKRFSPATINNYALYRVVKQAAGSLPAMQSMRKAQLARGLPLDALRHRPRSRRRLRKEPLRIEKLRAFYETGGYSREDCIGMTISAMQWANTRLFVDSVYPKEEDRLAVRTHVSGIVQAIKVAMRTQIDQLSWMTPSTKRGAYSKLDNLAVNIAYPDWVLNDTLLAQYYEKLSIVPNDTFLSMTDKVNSFMLYDAFRYLEMSGATDRKDFSGPAGITNAWYQPQMNSITFPGGILHAPFYDAQYPAAINFGAMGVIAGHELTHGFDDEGVQWDGTGILNSWMDGDSAAGFAEMAECVVNEYNGFCPLGGDNPCIDGAQTEGENIADNGGMQAAYKAYRTYVALNGPDPQLPGAAAVLTAEQLFFLSFAQIWCQEDPSPNQELLQILLDVHSPSLYRVFGTIQNFPEFQKAFNCPANSLYTPEKHCDVWTSSIQPGKEDSKGIPVVKENDINVAAAEEIRPRNLQVYDAYQKALKMFNASINFEVDPCENFYQYSCGNFPGVSNNFYVLDEENIRRIARKLNDPVYYNSTIQKSSALKTMMNVYNSCRKEQEHPTIEGLHLVSPFVKELSAILNITVPSILNGAPLKASPSPTRLAQALAYLSFKHGIDTLFTPMVDTHWLTPSTGYLFFLDQSTLQFPRTYYQGAWDSIKKSYKLFGTAYTTADDIRRNYSRQWNPVYPTELPENLTSAFNWTAYLTFEMAPPQLQNIEMMIFNEKTKAEVLNVVISNGILPPDTLVNYLFVRLLMKYQNLIVPKGMPPAVYKLQRDERASTHGRRRPSLVQPKAPASVDDGGISCANVIMSLMADASGRLYIDDAFPTQADRDRIREAAGGVIKNVLDAMSGMITQLDWMDSNSKIGAQSKISNIQRNVAFPDKLYNFTQLDHEYAELDLNITNDFYSVWAQLTKFNIFQMYKNLELSQARRDDFLGQTAVVNAWYEPELNSITFPAGILQAPYFDPDSPAALNYGAMAVVAGHELTHGFDDEGVQWDGYGGLNQWMDLPSSDNFTKNVAQCIINQYDKFCPLPSSFTPHCTDGKKTQGENIADNGGIHAAWRSFQAHVELNGPDPLFSDRVFSQFTENQLFFLNFAQIWCMTDPTTDFLFKRLLTDPHSLNFYRVIGSVQNMPAFRTAFNCPLNSNMAPQEHCNVWVPLHMAK